MRLGKIRGRCKRKQQDGTHESLRNRSCCRPWKYILFPRCRVLASTPSGFDSLMYIDFVDFADFVVSRILCSLFDCSVLHTAHRTPHIRIAHTSSFLFPPLFYRPYLVSWGGASPDDRFEIDLHYCGSYSFCFGEVRGVLALWARRSVDYPVNYRQYTCVLCNGTPRVITPTIFFTLASRGRMVQYELCTSIIQQ